MYKCGRDESKSALGTAAFLNATINEKKSQKYMLNFASGSNSSSKIRHIHALDQSAYVENSGKFILHIVTLLMDVSQEQLLNKSRSVSKICIARQTAMYLHHTIFSNTYCQVADFFGRDRTTVSHACRVVEDLRDDTEFDEVISKLETLASAALNIQPAKI